MEQVAESIEERSLLSHPGAIMFVSCYELGHQPLGIAQPMGFLVQAGFVPVGIDIAVENIDESALRLARFVGISVPMHTALRLGVRVAELIRAMNPACHICFYGLYASINAEYLLQRLADSVVGGEYEIPLQSLVEALNRGQAISLLEGVSSRNRVVGPSLRRIYASTSSAIPQPIPSRAGLPMLDQYARLEQNGTERLVGYVETSRGCLHHCLHCPIVPVYDGRLFLVPEAVVLEDIRRQVHAGATHITFGDPDFLNGPGHSLSIVRAMHKEFPHLTFNFTAKIEHLLKRRPLMPDLSAQGCLFVISAVESFSDHVLERLHKGHTGADIMTALGILREAGIALRPSFVAFTPWTSLDEYERMLDMVESHDLIDATDPVQLSIRLLIPPGSALLAKSDIHRFLGPLDQAGFQYPWTHPDERMDRLHQAVSEIVEASAKEEEDAMVTFDRIRAIADEIAGRHAESSTRTRVSRPDRPKPPRLTESWFCCAEPTTQQFRPLQTKEHGEIQHGWSYIQLREGPEMEVEFMTQGTQIQELLGLKVPAVAIAFRDTAPAGIPRVTAPAPAGCGYWKLAAEGQVFYTEASDHYTCPVGAHTHGVDLPPQVATELNGLVQTMVGMQYLTMAEIPMIPRRKETFHIAIYAPLTKATFTPDVVLVRGTVKQLMLLAEAAQSAGVAGGGATMGRPTCAVLPESLQSGHTATSFGCIGNRVYTGLGDDEGYYAIPGAKVADVVGKLAIITEANRQLEKFHRARAGTAGC